MTTPTLTLSDGTTTLHLPGDLEWTDEYAWLAVTQAVEYSLTGALVVDVGARQAGRPITLANEAAWITRADAVILRAWANTPGKQLTLTLADASVHTVVWRHQDAPALTVTPVAYVAPATPADVCTTTLKFMEI